MTIVQEARSAESGASGCWAHFLGTKTVAPTEKFRFAETLQAHPPSRARDDVTSKGFKNAVLTFVQLHLYQCFS